MMKRALSHPLMHFNKIERGGDNIIINKNTEETVEERDEEEEDDDELTDQVQCITLHKKRPQLFNLGEELSVGKHGMWRQKQMSGAARLERQMKARVALEDMIEEQLSRFQAHYNRAMVPTRLKDVAALLMPKWAPPHELAAMAWLGDWRPSSLLDLLSSLTRSSPSLDSIGVEQALPRLTHDIRIEEAVIDEEMAEIQANCILHLSFCSANKLSTSAALGCIRSEFTKIHGVIVKAQHLRFKVLELIVKKVLSQTDAAQFLVAFAGIQDTINQNARKHRMVKGSVSIPFKPMGSS